MGHYDTEIARVAARSLDLITWPELEALGLPPNGVKSRVRSGRLHRIHRGVYKVGTARLSEAQRLLAACLACGPGALLSHASAGHRLALLRRAPEVIHVTIPKAWRRDVRGVEPHQRPTLHPLDTSELDGVPLTPVPRTLVDLAASLDVGDLARAFHEAHVRYTTTPAMVEAAASRIYRPPGINRLRAAMGTDHRLTLSALERGFLRLLGAAGLPLPQTNVDRAGDKVDCHWPHLGLTIELHSFRYHATRHAFETDLARRRRSRHVAFSWGDVFERADALLVELRPLLRGLA